MKNNSIAGKTIITLSKRFYNQSRRLPQAAWMRWVKTLAIGLGMSALVAFLLTHWAMSWQNSGLQAWDEKWLLLMQDRSPLSFSKGVTWESPGNLIGMLPVFFTLVALTTWFRKPLIAATAVATYLGQFALVWLCWGTWNRERPTLIAEGIAAPGLHSFPSGHVVVSVTMYGLIFYLWYRASRNLFERVVAIAFGSLWISLISLSRLALGVHWPSDVLMGLGVGCLWLITVITALEQATHLSNIATQKPPSP